MRIAILTALADDSSVADNKRAFRMLAGRSVLSHQVDVAADWGAEAILCFVGGLNAQVVACQHRAEDAGLRFQAVENIERMVALIKPQDDVLVIQDGLLPARLEAEHVLAEAAVLTFPADPAVSTGFERIDADTAWAGLMTIRGETFARLTDLPEDCDVGSSLLRLALQDGVDRLALDYDAVEGREWFIRSDASQRALDRQWIEASAELVGFETPGKAVAQRMGLRLARDIAGTRFQYAPVLAGIVIGMLSLVLAWHGLRAVALVLAALTTLALFAQQTVSGVTARRGARRSVERVEPVPGVFLDLVLGGAVVLPPPARELWTAWALALILILTRRLLVGFDTARIGKGLADRIVLIALLLLGGAVFGTPLIACALLAVAMLCILLTHVERRDTLTGD